MHSRLDIKSNNKAISTIVSAIMVIMIVISTVGTVLLWGAPYIEETQSKADRENAEMQVRAAVGNINDLAASMPGDSKTSTISTNSEYGSISVNSEKDKTLLSYSYGNDASKEFAVTGFDDDRITIDMLNGGSLNEAKIYAFDTGETCFLAGTKILMADGSHKNIEDIVVGDSIKSYDESDEKVVSGKVSNVFHHTPAEMTDYYIVINNQLRVTPNHRFYSDGRWVYAADLKVGNLLFSSTEKQIYYIYSIKRVYERTQTFDLEVEYCHTYFVLFDDDGFNVLVHNPIVAGPPGQPTGFTATPLDRFRIRLTWTKASGTNIYTYIMAKLDSYPTSRIDGMNIYNNTGNSFIHTGLLPSRNWHYRAWSFNATSKTWSTLYASVNTSTLPNALPSYGAPSPVNGSNNQPLALTWQIAINDANGDLINWTIVCSNRQQASRNNDAGGTKSLSLSSLSYSKTYKVWVNATDKYGWTRRWYTFSTMVDPLSPPEVATLAVTGVNGTKAILNGQLINEGGEPCQIGFRYRTTMASTWTEKWLGMGGVGTFNCTLIGLPNGISYEYQAGARNSQLVWGSSQLFTTWRITLTTPNGGETWMQGSTESIHWASFGDIVSQTIIIQLYNSTNNLQWQVLVPNQYGTWGWTISDPHGSYKIKTIVFDDRSVYDYSNNYFYIVEQPAVVTLSATSIGMRAATLNGNLISLGGAGSCDVWFQYKDSPFDIATPPTNTQHQTLYSTGTFSCSNLPDPLTRGTKYYFRTAADNGQSIVYGNEMNFTTWDNAINIVSPKEDYEWAVGTTEDITWGYLEEIRNHKATINIYKEGVSTPEYSFLDVEIILGSKTWNIPSDATPGNYVINITDDSDQSIYASNDFSLIELHEGVIETVTISSSEMARQGNTYTLNLRDAHITHTGLMCIDLYDNNNDRFGIIWIFDSKSVTYKETISSGNQEITIEKGGIIYSDSANNYNVKGAANIYDEGDNLAISVVQMFTSSDFSFSGSVNKIRMSTYLYSSNIMETEKVYNMRLQFSGEHSSVWLNYYNNSYRFDYDQRAQNSLIYTPSMSGGVFFNLADSVIRFNLQ